ncbi:MAG TPA: hypothetical protein VKB37_14500 [Jatrophihabitantaceae bacterium]|jgi:hypothetical protein|nr:hypothetical protein [Jatrophihabitantaceae bacterium]
MSQVTREHVRDILAHAHLTPEQERNILELSYPADIEKVIAIFAEYGVTRDWLTDQLGGSP